MSTDEMKDGYTYLIENAMVSIFDVNQMETQLYKATITSHGKSLMELESQKGNHAYKFHVNFKVNTGIFTLEVGYENDNG